MLGMTRQTMGRDSLDGHLRAYARLICRQVPLAGFTTFGIGGPAEFLAEVTTTEELVGLVVGARAAGLPVAVLGDGSNVLTSDHGVAGLVVVNRCRGFRAEGRRIVAEAGARLNDVINAAINQGLGGMELMAGIPGTVGGAVVGNAGAYGQSISDVLAHIRLLRADGGIVEETPNELGFAYRSSRLKRSDDVVLAAELLMVSGSQDELRRRADEVLARRWSKLPKWNDCAGSYFKNIEDPTAPNGKIPAGRLLDEVGAKSFCVGRAAVSQDHANVIVNLGGATAAEVLALAEKMKRAVEVKFGVELEEEVRFLGRRG